MWSAMGIRVVRNTEGTHYCVVATKRDSSRAIMLNPEGQSYEEALAWLWNQSIDLTFQVFMARQRLAAAPATEPRSDPDATIDVLKAMYMGGYVHDGDEEKLEAFRHGMATAANHILDSEDRA